jgi:hypothetical protein
MTAERQSSGVGPVKSDTWAKQIRLPTFNVAADLTMTAVVPELTMRAQ